MEFKEKGAFTALIYIIGGLVLLYTAAFHGDWLGGIISDLADKFYNPNFNGP